VDRPVAPSDADVLNHAIVDDFLAPPRSVGQELKQLELVDYAPHGRPWP
jgi:hypothetical protein